MTFSIADLSDALLTYIVIYGPAIICLTLFLGALGVPLPGTFLVLASGAFIRQDVLNLYISLGLALVGVAIGDSLSYGMGRFARGLILRRFGQSPAWLRAEAKFRQRGGIAVYLTRWLLTPIAVPTNLVAGSGGYPFPRFMAYDIAGELTWLLLYGGLGYAFSSQWEAISTLISDFSGVLVGVAILAIGVVIIFRRRHTRPVEDIEPVSANS